LTSGFSWKCLSAEFVDIAVDLPARE